VSWALAMSLSMTNHLMNALTSQVASRLSAKASDSPGLELALMRQPPNMAVVRTRREPPGFINHRAAARRTPPR
jgi:hypothetical protein